MKCLEVIASVGELGATVAFVRWEMALAVAVAGFGVKKEAMDFCFLPVAFDA